MTDISIVPFRHELAEAFDRLNRAWLVAGGYLEPVDLEYQRIRTGRSSHREVRCSSHWKK